MPFFLLSKVSADVPLNPTFSAQSYYCNVYMNYYDPSTNEELSGGMIDLPDIRAEFNEETDVCTYDHEHYEDFVIDRVVSGTISVDNLTNTVNVDIGLYRINQDHITEIAVANNSTISVTDVITVSNLAPGHYYLYVRQSDYYPSNNNVNDYRVSYDLHSQSSSNLWNLTYSTSSGFPTAVAQTFFANSNLNYEDMVINGNCIGNVQKAEFYSQPVFEYNNLVYQTIVGIVAFDDITNYANFTYGTYMYDTYASRYLVERKSRIYFARVLIEEQMIRGEYSISSDFDFTLSDFNNGRVSMELLDNYTMVYDWNTNVLSYEGQSDKNDLTIRNVELMVRTFDNDQDPTNDPSFKDATTTVDLYEDTIITNDPENGYFADAISATASYTTTKLFEHVIGCIPGASEIYSWLMTASDIVQIGLLWVDAFDDYLSANQDVIAQKPLTGNYLEFYNTASGSPAREVGAYMTCNEDEGFFLTPKLGTSKGDNFDFQYNLHSNAQGSNGTTPVNISVSIFGEIQVGDYTMSLFSFESLNGMESGYQSQYLSGYTEYYIMDTVLAQDVNISIDLLNNPDNVDFNIVVLQQVGTDYVEYSVSNGPVSSITLEAGFAYVIYPEYLSDTQEEYVDGLLEITELVPPVQPTMTVTTKTETSITIVYYNPNDYSVVLFAERGDSTPDVMVKIMSPHETYSVTYGGLSFGKSYSFYSKFISTVNGLSSVISVASATTLGYPIVTTVSVTETTVTFIYQNTSSHYVKVYAEKNDSTPDVLIGTLAPYSTMTYTFRYLTPDTLYSFYVKFYDYTSSLTYSTTIARTIRTLGGGIILEGF